MMTNNVDTVPYLGTKIAWLMDICLVGESRGGKDIGPQAKRKLSLKFRLIGKGCQKSPLWAHPPCFKPGAPGGTSY